MIEFLQSLRADLSSRRLLPFVALAAVALIAAVAYAVTGFSGSSAPAAVASLPSISVTGSAPALPVTVAPTNPNEAVSETPVACASRIMTPPPRATRLFRCLRRRDQSGGTLQLL